MRLISFFLAAGLIPNLGSEILGEHLPAGPSITSVTIPSAPTVGVAATFTVVATGTGLTYQWDFGDGTVTPYAAGNNVLTHTYSAVGHLTVVVNVQDVTSAIVSQNQGVTVHYPLTATKPTNSSTIIFDPVGKRVWCVNVDQDTVSAIDTTSNTLVLERPVGKAPRTLAQAADGTIWVVSQQHPSISVLDALSGNLLHVIPLPHGSLPYGICMTPDGSAAYVSFQGLGGATMISTATRAVLATSSVPPSARGISVTSDGRVFVTRFISPQSTSQLVFNSAAFLSQNHGEVVELTSSLGVVRTINLAIDPGVSGADPDLGNNAPPGAFGSRGVPNYLTSMVITPDGRRAWVPSKKDNVQRGTGPMRDGLTPGPEITYRAIISSLDLTSTTKTADELTERFDFKNSEMPQAACTSPLGDLVFVALQGNNRVQVRDLYNTTNSLNAFGDPTGTTATNGLAPQGLVLDPVGKNLYVHNYMGRSVSVFNAAAVLGSNGAGASLGTPTVVGTITGGDPNDALGANVLRGKRVFYNASDPRMSLLGYISCAGCHLDGGSDARVWDFTNRGEGFRNTIILQGRGDGAGGMKHGNVHWSANFDEIEDFDNDIFFHFGGTGFPPNATPPPPNPPMGAANLNIDPTQDLNRLSDYVTSLSKVSRSPFRNADGSLTASGARGEQVFVAQNCATCHKGREFTDSTLFTLPPPGVGPGVHNVGTLKATSGQRLNNTLPGIDTPTLKGVWQTPPYLHDGSAAALTDVVAALGTTPATQHAGTNTLTPQQQADLAEYLLEIDELEPGDRLSTDPPVTVSITSVDTGLPYSLATAATGSLPFVDRSYTISTSPLSANISGMILLRTSEDDKLNSSPSHLTVTLTSGADLYVFYDSRATKRPTWLDATWTATPPADNVTITPGLVMNAFKKTFPAGTVTLGGNLQGGPTGALRNYFVVINQTGSVFAEGPISQTEWVHDQDADGDGLHDEYEAAKGSSPWVANSRAAGTSDEDYLIPGTTTTAFQDQIAFETPVSSGGGGGGGGGGCGFMGLEWLVPLWIARRLRHRRR